LLYRIKNKPPDTGSKTTFPAIIVTDVFESAETGFHCEYFSRAVRLQNGAYNIFYCQRVHGHTEYEPGPTGLNVIEALQALDDFQLMQEKVRCPIDSYTDMGGHHYVDVAKELGYAVGVEGESLHRASRLKNLIFKVRLGSP